MIRFLKLQFALLAELVYVADYSSGDEEETSPLRKLPLTQCDQQPDGHCDRRLSLSEIDGSAQDLPQPICGFCLGKWQIM